MCDGGSLDRFHGTRSRPKCATLPDKTMLEVTEILLVMHANEC